jgi:hypothetical protein
MHHQVDPDKNHWINQGLLKRIGLKATIAGRQSDVPLLQACPAVP